MKTRYLLLFATVTLVVGCATFSQFGYDNSPRSIKIATKDYDIVGPVRREMVVYSVIGLPPFGGFNFALFTWGEATYDALLQEAHKMNADDVINITMDTANFGILTIIYNQRTYIANGLAIRYKGGENPRVSTAAADSLSEPKPALATDASAFGGVNASSTVGLISGFEIDGPTGSGWSGGYSVISMNTTRNHDVTDQTQPIIEYLGDPEMTWILKLIVSKGYVTAFEISADDKKGSNFSKIGQGVKADTSGLAVYLNHFSPEGQK